MSVSLITGPPGVGKTTVIRKLADRFGDLRLGGFWTAEVRRAGEREGFRLCTFEGHDRLIASVHRSGAPRVGKYAVDVTAIDALAAAALALAADVQLYLVDEIGRMECLSPAFVDAMGALLASGKPVVASVALRGPGLIAEVKHRPGVRLWHVTHATRDTLPAEIARSVREQMA